MSTNTNLGPYDISSEKNLTDLLAHFDSDFVLGIIEDKITNRHYIPIREANIIASFEQNFKTMHDMFPGDDENINTVRSRAYTEIVDILRKGFNLSCMLQDSTDLYLAAYYLYEFLISDSGPIMINFFTSFIINNKDSLYNSLNLENYRKNKDSSTLYNKRIYVDPKYVTISANLELVLDNIITLDITLDNIIQTTYMNPQVVNLFAELITDKGDYFKDYYCSLLKRQDELPVILTDIRLQLQRMIAGGNNIDNFITKEVSNNEE